MNFQKSWDIDFQKFLDCDILLKNFKIFKNFDNVLILIDFVWLIYRICETSPELKKHKFFLFEVNNFLIKLHGA